MDLVFNVGAFLALVVFFVAGCIGGAINGYLTMEKSEGEGAILLPRWVQTRTRRIFYPGVFGNVFVGGVTAVVVPCLYGSLSYTALFAPSASAQLVSVTVTLGQFATALLAGVGGSRLLSSIASGRLEAAAREDLAAFYRDLGLNETLEEPENGGDSREGEEP